MQRVCSTSQLWPLPLTIQRVLWVEKWQFNQLNYCCSVTCLKSLQSELRVWNRGHLETRLCWCKFPHLSKTPTIVAQRSQQDLGYLPPPPKPLAKNECGVYAAALTIQDSFAKCAQNTMCELQPEGLYPKTLTFFFFFCKNNTILMTWYSVA